MITKTIPVSIRLVISYTVKQLSHFKFDGKSMETEMTTSEFPNGKAIVEQILASGAINKSKGARL